MVDTLQLLLALATEALHPVFGIKAARLIHHPLQLVLEVRAGRVLREEGRFGDGSDEEVIVAPAVGCEMESYRASSCGHALDDDVVWITAKLGRVSQG